MKRRLEDFGAALAFAELGCFDEACDVVRNMSDVERSANQKMIVVTHGGAFLSCFMEYVISLTERTRLDIVSVHLLPLPRLRIRRTKALSRERETLLREAEEAFEILSAKTGGLGLACAQIIASREAPSLVDRLCRSVRGVEFAVIQAGEDSPRLSLPLPVYRVGC